MALDVFVILGKWFTRVVVAAAVIDALDSLDLHYPTMTKEQRAALAAARAALDGKGGGPRRRSMSRSSR